MIKITDRAKEKIIEILTEEKLKILRFGLKGGGCSGFQYFFSLEQEKDPDDLIYNLNENLMLVIDPMSDSYLDDASIDYKKDIMGESFVFENPNSKTKCGCGQSFSV